jgi:hypothetical protein
MISAPERLRATRNAHRARRRQRSQVGALSKMVRGKDVNCDIVASELESNSLPALLVELKTASDKILGKRLRPAGALANVHEHVSIAADAWGGSLCPQSV